MTATNDRTAESASRRRRIYLVVAVIALCAVAALAVWTRPAEEPPAAAPAPLASTPTSAPSSVTPTVTATPTPTAVAPVGPAAAAGAPVQLRVDAVGLDAEVRPTASVGGAFDPPTMDAAYWIEAFGTPGTESDNTVYLIGHSWDDGDAVFNALFDRATQTSKVSAGDTVVVSTDAGEVTYTIDRAERLAKEEVAQEANEVWDVVPGRLLLITCFQNNEGGQTLDNFVVFASLAA